MTGFWFNNVVSGLINDDSVVVNEETKITIDYTQEIRGIEYWRTYKPRTWGQWLLSWFRRE